MENTLLVLAMTCVVVSLYLWTFKHSTFQELKAQISPELDPNESQR